MVGLFALALAAQQAPVFTQATVSGIVVTEFELPQGLVSVYLPADMAAGDTVSGTVIAEPKGEGEARLRNDAVLRGVVIEVGGSAAQRSDDKSSCWIRVSQVAASGGVALRAGSLSSVAPLEVAATGDAAPSFTASAVAPTGRPMAIVGPFDGDYGTTRVTMGGKPATVFVESPRGCVVQADPSFVGPKSVVVTDGEKSANVSVHFAKITLTAAKTTLVRGERTTMTVTVDGLGDAPATAFPVPVELENRSRQTIDLPSHVNFAIERKDLDADGRFSRDFALTSVQSGGFVVTGTVFYVSLHHKKSLMSREDYNAWINALLEMYKRQLAKLKAEKAAGNDNPGLQANIDRKQKIVDTLPGLKAADGTQKSNNQNIVDQLLAVDNFFSVASDLISLAAELLGYTDLPMPGIGTLLKGLAALAKGSATAADAVKKAQTIYDAIGKVQNAQEKADKARELKEALDKVKAAMSQG
jgi:hypothetical protein